MNLRTYTLSVSLAAVVGLLFSVVPLVSGALEYRSPAPKIKEPEELSSFETFVVSKEKRFAEMISRQQSYDYWKNNNAAQWQGMYEAAKAQYEQAVRQEIGAIRRVAARNMIAYGSLFALCAALLVSHLLWARRLARVAP